MPPKCPVCRMEFKGSDPFHFCVECRKYFHPACTKNSTKTGNKQWKCDSCRGETSSVKSSEDDDTQKLLKAMQEMKTDITKQVDGVQGSIDSLRVDFISIKARISSVETSQQDLGARCSQLEEERDRLSAEVLELRQLQRDADQHFRSANLEIQGMPQTREESVYAVLAKIAQVLNVPFGKEDISTAYRLKQYSAKHRYPPIIAQFMSKEKKELWLMAARRKKGLRASDIADSLPMSNVYINEHLTSFNKILLGRARGLVRAKKLYHAGYYNGKVMIKTRDKDEAIRLTRLEDLDKYD